MWRAAGRQDDSGDTRLYQSVDPAPPFPVHAHSVSELSQILTSAEIPLFDRYRAMFSLRNLNSDAAALALVQGLNDSSALFRHEIAYVLGQMQRPCAIDGLESVLKNLSEHRMVRHEAAESIGAIGGEVAENVLKSYALDGEVVVQQSCEVALDTMDYWNSHSSTSGNESQVPIKYL